VLLAAFFVISCWGCSSDSPTEAPSQNGWALVWHDEFDGSVPDSAKWECEVDALGGWNNELQYYTARPANVHLAGGSLVIEARQELFSQDGETRQFTSARIRSLGLGDWRYGRFVIRAKLPEGRGIWPAIWMLPSESIYGGWAASGEIDIMEMLGHDIRTVYGTLHYGGAWPNNISSGISFQLPTGDFHSQYHVFRLDWEPTEIRWYIDDILYQTQHDWHTLGYPYPAPFDQAFHLVLNVAVGGNWPGAPTAETTFPQAMLIDYVRVYQQTQ